MHYTSLELTDYPVFVGNGSYGEVSVYYKDKVAVKTAIEGFRNELLMTLVASECAIKSRAILSENRIITLLAFSLPSKQMVFPMYDMDMGRYCRKLARIEKTENHWKEIERAFIGLGRAIVYLNTSCGLTHLDVKCGNIFVNVSNEESLLIKDAVLGDFSLMLFNANSIALKATFLIDIGRTKLYPLKVRRGNVQPVFDMILGHGQMQPSEIIIDAMNGTGLMENKYPLLSEIGIAIDIYALGQCIIELVLSAGMNNMYGFGFPKNPLYFYHHRHIRIDYLLDILAYRCCFYRYILPLTPLTSRYDVPWERPEKIRTRLHNDRYRTAFDDHVTRYEKTHRLLFENIQIPPMLRQTLELAALYCHANPKARSATPLLWC